MLGKGITIEKELESVVGKLNLVGFIILAGRYFISSLRYRLSKAPRHNKTKLAEWDIADLKLWRSMHHEVTHKGIRIDHIFFSIPLSFCILDASSTKMGVFTCEGVA